MISIKILILIKNGSMLIVGVDIFKISALTDF